MMQLRRSLFLFALIAVVAAATAHAEAAVEQYIQLKDGSVLHGEVLAMDADDLILRTAYADSLTVPREQIKAILLQDPRDAAAPSPPASPPADTAAAAAMEGTGELEVALIGDLPRSSTRYRSPADRERMLELNTLHLKIYVDGELASETVDDSIEKEFYDRGWTFLRNQHQFPPVTLSVPAGPHRVLVVVGNEFDRMQVGEKQSQLLSAELEVPEVLVRPDEKSRLVISGDGSRFKYGKYEMELKSRR